MSLPHAPVGFDYAEAIRRLNRALSYEQIAEFMGYESRNGVYAILRGSVPPHPQGEALFVLYRQIFGKKPPMTPEQVTGAFVTYRDTTASLSTA